MNTTSTFLPPYTCRNNETAHLVTQKGVANARPSYTKLPGPHQEEKVYCCWRSLLSLGFGDLLGVFLEGGAVGAIGAAVVAFVVLISFWWGKEVEKGVKKE